MPLVGLYLIVATGVLVGGVFAIDPSLDLEVARFFTRPETRDLLAFAHPYIEGLRLFNFQLTLLLLALACAAVGVKMARPDMTMLLPARLSLLVLAIFTLGPGLLANGILKTFWGRVRPRHLVEFGGKHDFTAWWDPTGACIKNCSFISGEASSAFALLALAALVPAPLRYAAIGAALLYGALVGFIRIAVGAHFVSDVLFAGVFVALMVWVLHGLLWRWKQTAVPESVAAQMIGDTHRHVPAAFAAARRNIVALTKGLVARKSWKPSQQLAAQSVQPAGSTLPQ
ncbi:MAG TPA: phosphatase PAP2 family protein [Pseudorhodoplanes sp.]|nr:phosphatase PAP2 family protein [Pseudorhodoplanes sp.]